MGHEWWYQRKTSKKNYKKEKKKTHILYTNLKPNDETFELIKVKGREYYYNIKRRELRDIEGNIKGNFVKGKVVFV